MRQKPATIRSPNGTNFTTPGAARAGRHIDRSGSELVLALAIDLRHRNVELVDGDGSPPRLKWQPSTRQSTLGRYDRVHADRSGNGFA